MKKKHCGLRFLSALALASGILLLSMTTDACSGAFSSLYFSTSALPTAQFNTFYQSAILVTGGVTPYTYVIYSGSLPPGLYINPYTGVIYGVPTAVGRFTFVIRVYDARYPPLWSERTFVITVIPL
jgi:hypothetical protein